MSRANRPLITADFASCLAIVLGVILLVDTARSAEHEFRFGDSTLILSEATGQVDVYFQAMRFNRAAGVWNVEATVSNKSPVVLQGPLILLVDQFAGTTGPVVPDGLDTNSPPKGYYDLSGVVSGGGLMPGQRTSPRTLSLGFTNGAPVLQTRFFVLGSPPGSARALTRSLDDVGQPLPGVTVTESGPQGPDTNSTDELFGVVTLGQGTGSHVWKFDAPGFLPVWRQLTLATGAVAMLPNPRLSSRSDQEFTITQIGGGQLTNRAGTVRIILSPGSFSQDTTGRVTSLTGQTLPALLPQGWSPLQAFWLELGREPVAGGAGHLAPWGALDAGERAAVVRWNPATLAWDVLQVVSGSGTNPVSVAVPGSGAFALVVGDTGPLAPPPPLPGAILSASLMGPPSLSSLIATGSVLPAVSSASLVPELVTANAQLIVSNQSGTLASGLLLRCELTDDYQLTDGTHRRLPQYENFIVAYQRPGDANPATLHATFPMRPVLLLDGDELREAMVKVDVIEPAPFDGVLLDSAGGQIASEDIRVLAGGSDLRGTQAVQLRVLNPTNFSDFQINGVVVLRAFDLLLDGVAPGRRLLARFGPQSPNSRFVLARVISHRGLYGLEPRERLASDASGNLSSLEPLSGERLPGITGAGQYVLLRVPAAQGLVMGVAANTLGQPVGGLAMRTPPWLTFSMSDGSYRLLAPTGLVSVAVTDLATGDTGLATGNLADPQSSLTLNPGAAENAPVVLGVFPAPDSSEVSRVTAVTVTFSTRINPATLLAEGIQLLGRSNQPVAVVLSLNLRGSVATLLPTDPLAPNTLHNISLSTNVADFNGRKLVGASQFFFTTENDRLNRPLGAQVISHEPTNGVARMEGTQGIADPNAPVILVNETSGRTATVLASADGSFTNFIQAEVDDFLSAVLVNQNGTRTTIPVSRQIYVDGRVGLFASGGELTAEGGEGLVAVAIPPGAIAGKAVFRLESLSVSNVLAQFNGVVPSNSVMAAAMRLEVAGDLPGPPLQLRFDFPPTNLPPGRDWSNLVAIAAVPQVIDGVTAYQYVGQARLTNGLASRPGLAARAGDLTGLVSFGGLGGGAAIGAFAAMSMLIMDPDLYAPAAVVGVAGPVTAAEVTAPYQVVPGTEIPLSGAVVTISDLADFKARPARFFPGEVYAVTDEAGHYSMIAPQVVFGSFGEGFAAVATHPRFPRLCCLARHPGGGGKVHDPRRHHLRAGGESARCVSTFHHGVAHSATTRARRHGDSQRNRFRRWAAARGDD